VRSHLAPDDCISGWAIEKSRDTHPDIDHVLVSDSNFVAHCFDILPDRFDVPAYHFDVLANRVNVLAHHVDTLFNRRNGIPCPDHVLVNRLDLDLRPDGSLHLHAGSAKVSLGTHE
jgi:hypothetical protein